MGHFLNLSNHPLDQWSNEQEQAAIALGHGPPMDLPNVSFLVDPTWCTEQVHELAKRILQRALEENSDGAHVAGEFTLVSFLVPLLQAHGFRCYVATTTRKKKQSFAHAMKPETATDFVFVRWRCYPPLLLAEE